MNRNTYLSFQEALEYRYCASHDEIQELLSNIPELEIEKNWKNRGKNLLLNIDLALYFGIPFEDIVDDYWNEDAIEEINEELAKAYREYLEMNF